MLKKNECSLCRSEGYYFGEYSLNIIVPQKMSTFTALKCFIWSQTKASPSFACLFYRDRTLSSSLLIFGYPHHPPVSWTRGNCPANQNYGHQTWRWSPGRGRRRWMWDAEQGEGRGRAVGGEPCAPFPPQELLSFTQDFEKPLRVLSEMIWKRVSLGSWGAGLCVTLAAFIECLQASQHIRVTLEKMKNTESLRINSEY